MSFGMGYQPVDPTPQAKRLEEGTYLCMILGANEVQRCGYNIMEVDFKINGKYGYLPNKMSFFDRVGNDPEKAAQFDKQMTAFFDAFHIARGDFIVQHWLNKTGEIDVRYPKNDPEHKYPPKAYPHVEIKEQGGNPAQPSSPIPQQYVPHAPVTDAHGNFVSDIF